MKYLIIYNSERITSVTDYVEGTAIATSFSFMVDTIENAIEILQPTGRDVSVLKDIK